MSERTVPDARALEQRLAALFDEDGRDRSELEPLARLIELFAELPPPPDPGSHFPEYGSLRSRFLEALGHESGEQVEERLLELYCHVHMHEAPYSREERRVVDASGGYWCHAGGLSPILRAGPFLGPEAVSADFGAGNGLQGLLLQRLHPHARTVQIEISAEAASIGRRLQEWLQVPDERVEWRVADVRDVPPRDMDFIYIYRPLHPVGPGDEFYARFAAELETAGRPVVIFSIADCLRDYLSERFEAFYSDGHLTCFRGPRDEV